MAIKAVWAVWHGCGHEEGHDLSAKRAFRRASYARWLAGRDCSGCRWARQNMRATEEHARNQAEFQPDEIMEITELALPNSKAVLSGSKAAVDWAYRVWLFLHGASCGEGARTSAAEPARAAEAPAWRLIQASGWLRQRRAVAEVGDLMADGAVVPPGGGKEAC